MPFEFTGAPPLQLDTPLSFSSFASSSTTSFTTNAHPPASPFGASPISSSFGSIRPQLGGPQPLLNRDDFSRVSAPVATDPLSRALVRALRNRPAILGRSDIAGDQVVKDTLKQDETFDIPAIISGLRELEKTHPEVARFTRSLFDTSVLSRLPPKQPQIPPAIISTANANEAASNDQAPDTDASATRAPADSTASPTSPTEASNPEPPVKVPRQHPRIASFVDALAARVLRGAVVTYPEGAKVLASHIVNLFYSGSTQGDVVAALRSLLGRPDNISEIADVASWADDGLVALETAYADDPESFREASSELNADEEISDAEEEANAGDADEVLDENKSSTDNGATKASLPARPFCFLELPAEMRNLVYRLLLAPDGHIGLTKLVHTANGRYLKDVLFPDRNCRNSCGANYYKLSGCSPQILAVCQQIYDEAKQIMYEENTVCVTASTYDGVLVLNQRLLPDRTLPRLTSLMLVCDAADRSGIERGWFSQLPWKQLQDLTSLKSLRISMIERETDSNTTDSKAWILEEVLERIPAACQVTFESREEFEVTYVQEIIDETEAQINHRRTVKIDDVYEVEGEVLQELATRYVYKQGRKSGHARDYRFPDRWEVVSKLMPLSEVDPKLVLGGQRK
ncbi:hypothetical protein CLAFUW4_13263 [Fulvia fulva]|uniref:DUF7730 domain-containing protein n=1 Tax=Passalora fulva TaxID=5499 RepID=A0A9Q8UV08_PASFU|nr:uncharacterized protein CLAFUR5_13119 [Fulvia fulva]KAK4612024.1 hypothetical protein CLAFUR4_13268 [Fulvia fulva]KAK4612876.1 hypothetical protein CLAFUR0_13273 [Fulvia fulva]UJO23337.1 hypothetical protein CLAFUR5_13119 [Fulvia fulva]WPV21477.1 hypothetical protein CLAFUW4_13263 [Fulvia fulva]WPV35781.1 hypothetical protein CLAFUW7_13270 [Fulvia fulva]